MKYRIHWQHNHYRDYLVIEGSSKEEIYAIAANELRARGVPEECAWSEEVQD